MLGTYVLAGDGRELLVGESQAKWNEHAMHETHYDIRIDLNYGSAEGEHAYDRLPQLCGLFCTADSQVDPAYGRMQRIERVLVRRVIGQYPDLMTSVSEAFQPTPGRRGVYTPV